MKKRYYPLTMGQKSISHAPQLYPGTPMNNIGGLVLIDDELDYELMKKTVKLTVMRNDALRLRLVKHQQWRGNFIYWLYKKDCRKKNQPINSSIRNYLMIEGIRQKFVKDPPVELKFVDFTGKTLQEMDDAIFKWNQKPVDIFNEPLYDFTMIKAPDGRYGVFSRVDHLVTDAWMSMILCNEIVDIYYALKNGEELPEAPLSFKNALEAEEKYLKSQQYKDDMEYWMNIYSTKPEKSFIQGDNDYPLPKKADSRRFEIILDKEKTGRIHEFCRTRKISPPSLFQLLLGLYIFRYRKKTDITIMSLLMLRATLKEKRTCGPLINSLLIRMLFDGNMSFLDACRYVNDYNTKAIRHCRLPLLKLMGEVHQKHNMTSLFDTSISYQVAKIPKRENIAIETKWYSTGYFSGQFFMNITDLNDTGTYNIYYEYQTSLFTHEKIAEIHKSMMEMLEKGMVNPEILLKDI